jgi:hypothetical protein
MLVDMPSNLVVPTVCVNDRIFFVDELQTSDGTYFIPHRFFYRLPKGAKLGIPTATGLAKSDDSSQAYEPSVCDLWSLGRKVVRTDVRSVTSRVDTVLTSLSFFQAGFVVSDEESTAHVDMFRRTFLDIQSNNREFKCGFAGVLSGDSFFHANSCLLRYIKGIWVTYAAPFAREGRRSDGLHGPCYRLHGRCLGKHLEAVEQAHRRLLVQRWASPRDVGQRVLYKVHYVIPKRSSHGAHARCARFNGVCLNFYSAYSPYLTIH